MMRAILGICGTIVGLCCASFAFWNGMTMVPGNMGLIFGSALFVLVIGSWFLLPQALNCWKQELQLVSVFLIFGWVLCKTMVLVGSIGFIGVHRDELVGNKTVFMDSYDLAKAKIARSNDELKKKNLGLRERAQIRADINQAEKIVSSGKPASADPQADILAWLTGLNSKDFGKGLPIFFAIILDLAADFFWVGALVSRLRRKEDVNEPVDVPHIPVGRWKNELKLVKNA